MAATDAELLSRYTTRRDAGALAEIVSHHRDMVYAACLRVVHNAEDAEDLTQECFLRLARKAASIRGSLAGWLHRTAVNASIDKVRRDRARVEREQAAMELAEGNRADEATWAEIEPEIDRAIDELPAELREPLVLFFLEGKDQLVVARELGMSRFAVRRRVNKGVDELRERLRKAGVVVSAAALAALLSSNAVQAAPATVVASLGKLSLAGIVPEKPAAAAGVKAGPSLFSTSTAKTAFTVLITIIVGVVLYNIIRNASGGHSKGPLKVPTQQQKIPDTLKQGQQQMQPKEPAMQKQRQPALPAQTQEYNVNTAPQGAGGQRRLDLQRDTPTPPTAKATAPAGGDGSVTPGDGLRTLIRKAGDAEAAPPKKGK